MYGLEITSTRYLAPVVVWAAIFFPQAHKEERFLFPMYPLVCLSGAYTVVTIIGFVAALVSVFPVWVLDTL